LKEKMKADIARDEIDEKKTVDIVGKEFIEKVEHKLQMYAEGVIVREGKHLDITMEDATEKTFSTNEAMVKD